MKGKYKISKLLGWTVYVNNFVEDDVNIHCSEFGNFVINLIYLYGGHIRC
jgi:hypothetical protein